MKARAYLALFCICLLLAGGACKHKKSASKQKVKKAVAAKAPMLKNPPHATVPNSSATTNNTDAIKQKLGVSDKELKNSRLLVFINDWYGVPYKYGGCQKTGIDCSCFTNLLYEKVYNKKTGRSADEMYQQCEKLPLDEIREGDLVFFKINSNNISHVGVYLRNKLFVHSSTSKGVIINSMDEAYYKKYFHSGGRFKSI